MRNCFVICVFLFNALGLNGCVSKPYKYPEGVCSENNFSSKCIPEPCTDNKARELAGSALIGIGAPFLFIGFISAIVILSAPNISEEASGINHAADKLVVGLVGGFLIGGVFNVAGQKMKGNVCK